jgi:hypothetical protein
VITGVVDVPVLALHLHHHVAGGAEAALELVLGVDERVLRPLIPDAGVHLEARDPGDRLAADVEEQRVHQRRREEERDREQGHQRREPVAHDQPSKAHRERRFR